MRHRRTTSVLAAACIALLAPAAASAETRTGSVTDAAGDSAVAGADLVGADASVDTATGAVTVAIRLAAAPTATDAFAIVALGEPNADGSCSADVALGTNVNPATVAAAWSDGVDGGPAQRTQDGATLRLTATDARLAADVTCLRARLVRDGAATQVLDDGGSGPLSGPPATPDPAPSPDPADPSPSPAPEPSDPKAKPTPLEQYDAARAACAKQPKRSRAACRRKAAKRYPKGAAVARKRERNPLIGRVYLQFQPDVAGVCGGGCVEAFAFTDDRFVYRGVHEDGPAIVRCTKVTATGDKDGCLRYAWNRARKTMTVGGHTFRLGSKDRRLAEGDGNPYWNVSVPRAGLRIAVALTSISSFGIPGVNQSFSSSELTLSRDGHFVLATAVSGTSGQGSDFETTYTALPADRRGTYAFEPGGTLALRFDSGHTRRDSAVVAFAPGNGAGKPERDGFFLDGSFFNPPDDD